MRRGVGLSGGGSVADGVFVSPRLLLHRAAPHFLTFGDTAASELSNAQQYWSFLAYIYTLSQVEQGQPLQRYPSFGIPLLF